MAEVEYLSLYSERNDREQIFYVKNYPAPGAWTVEDAAVETLASVGWRLVSTAPTRAHRVGQNTSRLLNLERVIGQELEDSTRGRLRLQRREGKREILRGVPPTGIGQKVRAQDGLMLKFLGITRVINGAPDRKWLGRTEFPEDVRRPFAGVVSIDGARTSSLEDVANDLYCQFLHCGIDGIYRDDVHEPEAISLQTYGLMVGVPFGETYLTSAMSFRRSKYEYVVYRGARELTYATEVLVRFRFEILPGR